ncbi:MAG: hypothetical protein AAFO04_29870 [Cyanobacteria bacterium J06592_8]
MGVVNTISGLLFGTSGNETRKVSTNGSFAIEGKVAQIGNGVGQVITPDDRETVGVFIDGGLVKMAESNGLAIEPWMAAEAEAMEEKFKGYRKDTKRFCKATRSISKNSVEIVDDVYKTKSEVSRNHVKQHQAHNRFLDTQDKNAGAMNTEEKRRDREKQRVEDKLANWEAKMNAHAQAA